jgi:hypothetical protein
MEKEKIISHFSKNDLPKLRELAESLPKALDILELIFAKYISNFQNFLISIFQEKKKSQGKLLLFTNKNSTILL